MAVLQKIRVKFGLAISIIIALALLSFIIDPTTLSTALQSMSSKYDVGEIDGKSISYTDFLEDVERYTTIHELTSGSSSQSEEQQEQIRDAAWQELLDKYLFIKNAKAAGINVGEAEMVALTTGDMVSPILSQNYAFCNQEGVYDPQMLVDFVKNIGSDASGSYQAYWNFLQNSIYTQQFHTKYNALFSASNFQNALMLRNDIEGNNNTSKVEFVMVPSYYSANDSTLTVSDDEVKAYYNLHKKQYKQKASRDIEYIVYEVVPSSADISATNDAIAAVYDEFASTDNMKSFLLKNSDRPLSTFWYKEGELNSISSDIDAFAFSKEKDAATVSPIITDNETFYAARVMDSAMIPDSAFVKHILLTGDNAAHVADSLLNELNKNKASFSNLAAMYSIDQNSATDGELGNIGWMTQNYMIPGMESVITAEINKPYVITTDYGTHVVLVSKKTKPVLKKQVAILEKTALASKETYNKFYANANKFATIANGSYSNYKKAQDSLGIYSHPMENVLESNSTYGAIDGAKELTRWIFEAKPGKVSNVITVNNNYFFVATVKGLHKEGYATVEEVAPSIKSTLLAEKRGQKIAAEVSEKINGLTDIQDIAEKLGQSVSTQDVAFATMSYQTLDPKFVGAVAVAPDNKLVGPVIGNIAVYVFQVVGHDTGSFYTEDDAHNLEAQKNAYNAQMILSVMQEAADVKDNRAHFF